MSLHKKAVARVVRRDQHVTQMTRPANRAANYVRTMRVGVIGGGWIAQSIAGGIAAHGSDLIGICDTDPERLVSWAGWAVPTFLDHRALLDAGKPDVVFVLTPTSSHAAVTLDALEAGCDVVVEKPIAVTIDEASAMVQVAASLGRQVLVEESYLYMPSHVAALAMMAEVVGTLRAVQLTFYGWLPHAHRAAAVAVASSTGWRGAGSYPWIRDHVVHLLALSRRMAGGSAPTDVRAFGGPGDSTVTGGSWRCGTVDVVWLRATKGDEGVFGARRGLHTRLVGDAGYLDVLGEGGAWGDGGSADAIRLHDGRSLAVADEPDLLWQADVGYYPSAHHRSVAVALDHLTRRTPDVAPYTAAEALEDLRAVDALVLDAERAAERR